MHVRSALDQVPFSPSQVRGCLKLGKWPLLCPLGLNYCVMENRPKAEKKLNLLYCTVRKYLLKDVFLHINFYLTFCKRESLTLTC